jgi:hypothetical protein
MQKFAYNASNIFAVGSSFFSVVSALVQLCQKREHSWRDYFQLSMSLFMFCNIVTKVRTLKNIFESEQMNFIKKMEEKLKDDENVRKGFEETLKNHKSSDEKAYFIRNVQKIDDPSEFFELIHKTGSTVICTADGIAVNGNIDMSPLNYNEMFKSAFNIQMDTLAKTNIVDDVAKDFIKDVPESKQAMFEESLKEIAKLPYEKQAEATINLLKDSIDDPTDILLDFNTKLKNAEETLNGTISEMLNESQLGQGQSANRSDFNELEQLAKKKVYNTITEEETSKLQEYLEKCAKHRKEYFLNSSKFNETDQRKNIDAAIKSFTNGRNERLCYRINVKDVKDKLVSFINDPKFQNFEALADLEIGGTKIFNGMKTGQFDRLNRVFNELGKKQGLYFKAAVNIANEPSFAGLVKSPADIASLTQLIHNADDHFATVNLSLI